MHRDRTTDTGWALYPNPASGEWSDGYITWKVNDGGPNHPLWFIKNTDFEIDQETVINKYIKSNGPPPHASAPWNWYDENGVNCFTAALTGKSITVYLDLVYKHENMGAFASLLNPAGTGHHAQMIYEESLPGNDVAQAIEDNISGSEAGLESMSDAEINTVENAINGDPGHVHVQNWERSGGLPSPLLVSTWSGSGYSSCSCQYPKP